MWLHIELDLTRASCFFFFPPNFDFQETGESWDLNMKTFSEINDDCLCHEERHTEQRIDCCCYIFFLYTSVPVTVADSLLGQIYVVFKSTRNVWILSPKALEELVHLRFEHTHTQTPPPPECHSCSSSAALLCWWWTKWSLAVYMDRTSSHWSQPLAFYWIYQVSPYKCWLIY